MKSFSHMVMNNFLSIKLKERLKRYILREIDAKQRSFLCFPDFATIFNELNQKCVLFNRQELTDLRSSNLKIRIDSPSWLLEGGVFENIRTLFGSNNISSRIDNPDLIVFFEGCFDIQQRLKSLELVRKKGFYFCHLSPSPCASFLPPFFYRTYPALTKCLGFNFQYNFDSYHDTFEESGGLTIFSDKRLGILAFDLLGNELLRFEEIKDLVAALEKEQEVIIFDTPYQCRSSKDGYHLRNISIKQFDELLSEVDLLLTADPLLGLSLAQESRNVINIDTLRLWKLKKTWTPKHFYSYSQQQNIISNSVFINPDDGALIPFEEFKIFKEDFAKDYDQLLEQYRFADP